jgi:hypothetical protein
LGNIGCWLEVITKANQTAKQLDDILMGGGITGDSGVEGIGVNTVEIENRCLFGGKGRGRLCFLLRPATSKKQAG